MRASGLIPHAFSLWGIAGTARPVAVNMYMWRYLLICATTSKEAITDRLKWLVGVSQTNLTGDDVLQGDKEILGGLETSTRDKE